LIVISGRAFSIAFLDFLGGIGSAVRINADAYAACLTLRVCGRFHRLGHWNLATWDRHQPSKNSHFARSIALFARRWPQSLRTWTAFFWQKASFASRVGLRNRREQALLGTCGVEPRTSAPYTQRPSASTTQKQI